MNESKKKKKSRKTIIMVTVEYYNAYATTHKEEERRKNTNVEIMVIKTEYFASFLDPCCVQTLFAIAVIRS